MLGEGGMSSVVHCVCSRTGCHTAIKMYHRDRMNAMNVKQVGGVGRAGGWMRWGHDCPVQVSRWRCVRNALLCSLPVCVACTTSSSTGCSPHPGVARD